MKQQQTYLREACSSRTCLQGLNCYGYLSQDRNWKEKLISSESPNPLFLCPSTMAGLPILRLLQFTITNYTLVIIFISQNLFYMFRSMKVHHQKVSCRVQALRNNVMSKYIWYDGESSVRIMHRMK
jgi:hypothetical protein